MKSFLLAAAGALALASAAHAEVSRDTVNRIADQAFNHGEVVETTAYLTDRIGGRLTNSPAKRQAEDWTAGKFREWGLANVRKEGFEFGRGWSIDSSEVSLIAPRALRLRAIPVAWTPATNGALEAEVVVAPMNRREHWEQYRGKLRGKIVLLSWPAPPRDATEAPFQRYKDADVARLDQYSQPRFDPEAEDRAFKRDRTAYVRDLDAFLKSEGAVAWARMSIRPDGLVHGEGYTYKVGQTPALPGVELAQEDYRRIARLAKTGPVKLRIDSRVRFHDEDTKAYNVFAEIPGADPKAGYVMAGAHLDSWVAADGAADNAAGSAVVMEAARILKTLGVKPKRSIRFALWSGEEQGLLGSLAWINGNLATRPLNADPAKAAAGGRYNQSTYPITPLPGYADLKAYFNIDNGSGRLHGLYAEGNLAAAPILREWLSPLAAFDATTVVSAPTGGTDHVYMQAIGLPGFQFIQDPLDYDSRVHHSNVDTFDHLRTDDLRQAAVVLATVLLQAAESDKTIPAKPLPTKPSDTDPFSYPDPNEN